MCSLIQRILYSQTSWTHQDTEWLWCNYMTLTRIWVLLKILRTTWEICEADSTSDHQQSMKKTHTQEIHWPIRLRRKALVYSNELYTNVKKIHATEYPEMLDNRWILKSPKWEYHRIYHPLPTEDYSIRP